MVGLNCTIAGVVHVHAVDGLVIAVGIAAVAFVAVDAELELSPPATWAARACAPRLRVNWPLAAPGLTAAAILEALGEFTAPILSGCRTSPSCRR
jgi:ABC-type molybdate transport system permease subunit